MSEPAPTPAPRRRAAPAGSLALRLVPLTRKAAFAFVAEHHRHHPAPVGDIYRVGVESDGVLVGVGIAGRPLARHADDGETIEVLRIAVLPGHPNACSMLYGALRRSGQALGFRRFLTYTLAEEDGASLRASGWRLDGETPGGEWSSKGRRRMGEESGHPVLFESPKGLPRGPKQRWVWP